MRFRQDITAEDARRLFDYDPKTGAFIWRAPQCSRLRKGDRAGFKSEGYYCVEIGDVAYSVHRIIWLWMTGAWPIALLDHLDGNGLNNRWLNLREATDEQNRANSRVCRSSKTGVKFVHRCKRGRFHVKIRRSGWSYRGGSHATLDAAQEAAERLSANLDRDFAYHVSQASALEASGLFD